jgi:HK97 gp10 family phage protein
MASIKTTMRIEGLSELEKALQELPRATGGNVLKRAIVKPAEVFAARARELAPVSVTPTHNFHLKDEIKVGKPKVISPGKAAFAAAMAEGATRAEAGQAARAANAAGGGQGRHAVVQVGPTHRAFYGLFGEFGTSHHPPHPFMRPAWDELAPSMVQMIGDTLAEEIEKARKRLARKAEREAAKMKSGR